METTDAVWLTRDMINDPPNHLNASALGKEIARMGKIAGFNVEVLNKGKIEELKMGDFLLSTGEVLTLLFSVSWSGIQKIKLTGNR